MSEVYVASQTLFVIILSAVHVALVATMKLNDGWVKLIEIFCRFLD